MPDLLFFGDTERSPAMRHELPAGIGDPFVLAIVGGQMHVAVSDLDRPLVEAAAPGAEVHGFKELGLFELIDQGLRHHEIDLELASRAVALMGLREAVADPDMPVFIADRFRADGIVLHLDHDVIAARRRVKSATELAGIRRAQGAAEAGLRAAAATLGRAAPEGDRLVAGGEVLTANAVRAVIREACQRHGVPAPTDLIVSSVWEGGGHEPGSGPLPANLPIVVDVWPRDEASTCFADMTRTFVVGDVPEAVREIEALVRTALERSREAVRPGITGEALYAIACDLFEEAGHRTLRTGPADDPEEGFQFSLGHGVGLSVHEAPGLGPTGRDELVAGDVVAIEPGLTVAGIGEVRLEDLVLVTENGAETLTRYPYDLKP
ncbi:MAG TPA: M24 family metallopeptidase [Gaiellales bacterium]|jgi:Xaa-Pro aminopeptidase|nr:M24 family metallopeptidase [Gaiellales bacterium]